MERKTVKRILRNHRIIPWAEEILELEQVQLSIAQMDTKWIVYSGDVDAAKKKRDYIEFESEADAKDFVASVPEVYKDIPLEDMDQKEFTEARETTKWKYEGTMVQIEE